MATRQITGAASKREAGNAGGRDDPERYRQTERVRRMVDISRRAARLYADGPARGVDAHAFHRREIDHEAVVAAAETGTVVATTPNREEQALVSREVHRRDDIGRIDTPRDQTGPLVDHAVIKGAHGIVIGIGGTDHSSAKTFFECRSGLVTHGCFSHWMVRQE